tara:strand:- start:444 stop:680 length:237 start_codon:yes stop_codon:yes gene_type:complete
MTIEINKRKTGSTYTTKNGVKMRQINLAVQSEIADKFDTLCEGLSRSVIFTQLINDKLTQSKKIPTKEAVQTYSILQE